MTPWLNWIDLVVLTILIRTLYSGFSRGVLTELLTLVGAVVITVVAVVFWRPVASWIGPWLWLSRPVVGVLVFWGLVLGCWFGVRQLRAIAGRLLAWQNFHWANQGVGACVGGVRGFWWAGFVLVVLVSSGYPFLEEAVTKRSVLGPRILRVFRPCLDQVAGFMPGATSRGGTLMPSVRLAVKGE